MSIGQLAPASVQSNLLQVNPPYDTADFIKAMGKRAGNSVMSFQASTRVTCLSETMHVLLLT